MTHTTQIQALCDLSKKIEAGEKYDLYGLFSTAFPSSSNGNFVRSLDGSLDAAKSLHEAVLGERWGSDLSLWRADLSLGSFASTVVLRWRQIGTEIYKLDKDPATAWLLAIIDAKAIELEIGE